MLTGGPPKRDGSVCSIQNNSGLPQGPALTMPLAGNLRLRPPSPAKGHGRIQRQIRRAFAIHGPEVTTGQVFDWCLTRHRHDCWRRRKRWSVVRVLMQVADRVGREATFPWGWLWRLKSPAADNVQLHEKRSDESRSETQYEHNSDVEQHVVLLV